MIFVQAQPTVIEQNILDPDGHITNLSVNKKEKLNEKKIYKYICSCISMNENKNINVKCIL